MTENLIRAKLEKIDRLRKNIRAMDHMLDDMYRAEDIIMDVPRKVRRRFKYSKTIREYEMDTVEVRIFESYLKERIEQMTKEADALSAEFNN